MSRWKTSENDGSKKEKLDAILQPSTQAKAFKITIEFGYKPTEKYRRAVDLARRMPTYREDGEGDWLRHAATYTPDDVEELFEIFNLVHEWESTEVLVNHKPLPFAHQLWLPLMWFYRI